ncbi:hypothetical protein OSH11_13770 [Kaistia dalseonensis]|uniref:Uncharacterized protein n=1 Tax=Kaistia dalseonensis TaxID=410840 RepID=A0ABU0H7U9_9HYPH|nr:hypothetical protein [Kaistia dalseonensis]MCX5495777.1 hypothetical protein [Kaistia dalseonensis]MDQ0438377.1 hypothetical protein [Kaistia dalseonensis]
MLHNQETSPAVALLASSGDLDAILSRAGLLIRSAEACDRACKRGGPEALVAADVASELRVELTGLIDQALAVLDV